MTCTPALIFKDLTSYKSPFHVKVFEPVKHSVTLLFNYFECIRVGSVFFRSLGAIRKMLVSIDVPLEVKSSFHLPYLSAKKNNLDLFTSIEIG